MPAITYEIGGKNTKLRESLKDSKTLVRDFRQNIAAQTKQMQADAQQVGGGKGLFGAVLGGNLAAKGAQVIIGAAKDAVNAMGEMQDAAEQLGVSAETLDRLGKAMEGSGVKTDDLRRAFQNLNDKQTAVKNGSKEAAEQFAQLGIDANTVAKTPLDKLLLKVADGLKGMNDEGRAGSAALDLLGSKSKRMVDTLRGGGEKLKTDMANVSGAISSANTKAIDDTADAAQSALSAVKGFGANVLGATVRVAQQFGGEVKKGLAQREAEKTGSSVEKAIGPMTKQEESEKAKADRKAFEAADHQRLQALALVAAQKEDIEITKEKAQISERITESEKDRADTIRSTFSFREKFEIARENVIRSQRALDKAPAGIERERAEAVRNEARAKFEQLKQTAIERAGLPLAEQQALARADKEQEKARNAAIRTFNSRERDRIDRAFRQGKISKEERDRQIGAIGVGAKELENLPKDQLKELQSLNRTMKRFTELLEKV